MIDKGLCAGLIFYTITPIRTIHLRVVGKQGFEQACPEYEVWQYHIAEAVGIPTFVEKRSVDEFFKFLVSNKRLGFLCLFETPIPEEFYADTGNYRVGDLMKKHWIYGETLDECYLTVLHWHRNWISYQRDVYFERMKAEEPAHEMNGEKSE